MQKEMKTDALKLALEVLEGLHRDPKGWWNFHVEITAIKEALAEQPARQEPVGRVCFGGDEVVWTDDPPESGTLLYTSPPAPVQQEPVAWHTEDHLTDRSATTYSKEMVYRWECKGWPVTPLYTTPPKREWVDLTDDDIDTIFWGASKTDLLRVREIEAKLKEKNT